MGAEQACGCERLNQEFGHLQGQWWWLFLFGALLAVCGAAAVIFPALTVLTTVTSVLILGIVLMVAGIATVVASFWTGKWSGMLVQLLVGILYLVAGYLITEKPLAAMAVMTLFMAAVCIVIGVFRIVAALVVQFPCWGWALLNGLITFLLGVIIYRQFPESGLWVIGLLVGIEMLFHGWSWIALSLAVKQLPKATA
ncbi:MAG: HdeD family acid-resistance protein [Thermoguttaceae bacterium]